MLIEVYLQRMLITPFTEVLKHCRCRVLLECEIWRPTSCTRLIGATEVTAHATAAIRVCKSLASTGLVRDVAMLLGSVALTKSNTRYLFTFGAALFDAWPSRSSTFSSCGQEVTPKSLGCALSPNFCEGEEVQCFHSIRGSHASAQNL